jgi:hypothetical protein
VPKAIGTVQAYSRTNIEKWRKIAKCERKPQYYRGRIWEFKRKKNNMQKNHAHVGVV